MAYQGSPMVMITTRHTSVSELNESNSLPDREVEQAGGEGSGDRGHERGDAEHDHPGDVDRGPVGLEGERRVGHGMEDPSEPAVADDQRQRHRDHGERDKHVVEAGIGAERAHVRPGAVTPSVLVVNIQLCV